MHFSIFVPNKKHRKLISAWNRSAHRAGWLWTGYLFFRRFYWTRKMRLGSDGQGGKNRHRHRAESERWPELSIRKVEASSVPYGEQVSHNGKTVWAAFHAGAFVCCAPTRDETRNKYAVWYANRPRGQHKGTATGRPLKC